MKKPTKATVRPMISAVPMLLPEPEPDDGDFDAVGVVDDAVGEDVEVDIDVEPTTCQLASATLADRIENTYRQPQLAASQIQQASSSQEHEDRPPRRD